MDLDDLWFTKIYYRWASGIQPTVSTPNLMQQLLGLRSKDRILKMQFLVQNVIK